MQKPFSLGNPSKRNVMLFAFPPTKLLRNNEGLCPHALAITFGMLLTLRSQ